ncbi:hypothetical protein AB0O28_26190 [Microbispora sp. NPDC088329]|uniref:hypothetical protein n=1 Tax=Microbispora sp. NPDC088329 TaxID=3154869 RepID=UPI003421D393
MRALEQGGTDGRPSPLVAAGLIVRVTGDEEGVRRRIAGEFGLAGRVPEYRAVLDREGVGGPEDVVIVGGEQTVTRRIRRLAEAGVTEFAAPPYGDAREQERTLAVLSGLARSAEHSS